VIAKARPFGAGSDKDAYHARFLAMLPQIEATAHCAFRSVPREMRAELVQAAVVAAYAMFVRLAQRDRIELAYASPLVKFAVRQVRAGRCVGSALNRHDLSSAYGRRFHGVRIERLDQQDSATGEWREALIEDRRCGPAEIAASRIDMAAWLRSLPRQRRKIATLLAMGETTQHVARQCSLTPGRISQMRRQLKKSWETFIS
jgi:hypothetical protein